MNREMNAGDRTKILIGVFLIVCILMFSITTLYKMNVNKEMNMALSSDPNMCFLDPYEFQNKCLASNITSNRICYKAKARRKELCNNLSN